MKENRAEPPAPLMLQDEEDGFRSRWTDIQTGFVDEPRRAVKEADALVADVTRRLTEGFTRERTKLEEQWSREEEVSTENLRVVLRRYRSFFDRLLGTPAAATPAPARPRRAPEPPADM